MSKHSRPRQHYRRGRVEVLDLHGMFESEARSLVEKRLDSAFVDGVSELRVVHGNGHGILKRMVNDVVRGCPLVSRIRQASLMEGGAGVCIVEFPEERVAVTVFHLGD